MHQAQQELLVLAAQNGNEQALECLIAIFHPKLVKFAHSLSDDHALVKDAVQDVWLSTSKKLRTIKDPRAFKSWLFRAVRWRVLDLQKAKSYRYQDINDVELTIELDESEVSKRQLQQHIANLTIQERSVIYLFYLAELSVIEIATVLEVPVGTIKSRLNRARSNLHQSMNQTQ